jgi:hypothetical protein
LLSVAGGQVWKSNRSALRVTGRTGKLLDLRVKQHGVPQLVEPGYAGAPHGLCSTPKDRVYEDLLAFIKG